MTSTAHLRIHQFAGLQPGPRLLVTGAVHGNEIHGTKAMTEIARQIDAGELTLLRGTLTFVPIVNPLANRIKFNDSADQLCLKCIMQAVAGFAKGLAPLTAVEIARRSLDSSVQPGADELEAAVKGLTPGK